MHFSIKGEKEWKGGSVSSARRLSCEPTKELEI
jgi:hypothetical protein